MSDDLITRLRRIARLEAEDCGASPEDAAEWKAADEIESLRAQVAVLTRQREEVLSVVPALLFEAFDYGQFADDFNQPLAKPVRLAVRTMLSTVRASKI